SHHARSVLIGVAPNTDGAFDNRDSLKAGTDAEAIDTDACCAVDRTAHTRGDTGCVRSCAEHTDTVEAGVGSLHAVVISARGGSDAVHADTRRTLGSSFHAKGCAGGGVSSSEDAYSRCAVIAPRHANGESGGAGIFTKNANSLWTWSGSLHSVNHPSRA